MVAKIVLVIVVTFQERDKDGFYKLNIDGKENFKSLFMVPSISKIIFANNHNPTITVDACHTCYYDLRIYVAVMQDGNGKLQLIAAACCFRETKVDFTNLFQILKENVIKETFFTLISDRGSGILSAFRKVFGENAQHFICEKHLQNNIKDWTKDYGEKEKKDVLNFVKILTTSTNQNDYNKTATEFKGKYPDIYEKLKGIKQVWTRIMLKEHIFGVLTSNAAEIVNSRMKRPVDSELCIRDCHIAYMVANIYSLMKTQINSRREAVEECIECYGGQKRISKYVMKKVNAYQKYYYAEQWNVKDGYVEHSVNGTINTYVINLKDKSCTCGLYQECGYPCIHVYAYITKKIGPFNNTMIDYVDEYYWLSTVLKTCDIILPNVPEISQEKVSAFIAGFEEKGCSAVENESKRYEHNASDADAIRKRLEPFMNGTKKKKSAKEQGTKSKRQTEREGEKEKKKEKKEKKEKGKREKEIKGKKNIWKGDDEDFVLNNSKVNQCSSSTSSTSLEEKSYDLERKRGHCNKRFKRADELRKEVHTLSQSMNYRKLKRNVLSSL